MPGYSGGTAVVMTESGAPVADMSGILGACSEAAPATDIAASGLNGRMQRVSQRLTAILAQLGQTLSVAVSNFPASFAISNWPAAFQISNFPTAFNVGNFPAFPTTQQVAFASAQPVNGTVNVGNLPATQPVSGTVNVGNLPATQQTIPAGASFRNISGAGMLTIKSGAGTLVSIQVNKAVSLSTVTIYDNTAASGTKIGTISHPLTLLQSQYGLKYDAAFANGLTIVTSAADDITVIYR